MPNPKSAATNWLVIGAVLIGGLIYLAFQRRNTAGPAANAPGAPVLEAANPAGRTAPPFTLKDVDGRPVSLAQYAGHPVVLDFWATWCGPCNIESPWWQALQDQYRAQGLVVIGVSEDDNTADVKKWLKDNHSNYPIVMDMQALESSYGDALGLPTTLYIGRNGKIEERVSGLEGKDELDRHIRKIL